ncbi:MAG: hypothetical protein H8E25_07875 [Planctomycetes bacterium]|nr:hypothetical protein [Planctomycetota bacterium]
MIGQLSLLCLFIAQSQPAAVESDTARAKVNLSADSISSQEIEGGLSYTLLNFVLTSELLTLSAQSATVEVLHSAGTPQLATGWGANLLQGLGFNSDSSSLQRVDIKGNVYLRDQRFTVTADRLLLQPANSTSEFINARATFSSNTVGPNGWPVLITAKKLLELPNSVLEFHQCHFSTCLDDPQHYSTSFNLLRATKLESGKMFWQPESAWLNVFGIPILPLPSPDFSDGEDFFGLKGVNFGSSRTTGNAITPKFGARTTIDEQHFVNWSVSPGYSDLRGLPLNAEADYLFGNYSGSLKAFYLNDNFRDFHRLGQTIARPNNQRHLIDWHNKWRFKNQWSLHADLALMSDHLVAPEFFRRDWLLNDNAESAIELFRHGANDYFAVQFSVPNLGAGYTPLSGFDVAPNPQGQYLSYQPQAEYLSYATSGIDWRPAWLSTSWGMDAGRMMLRDYEIISATSADYINSPNAERTRLSAWAEADANFQLGGVHLVPAVAMRGAAWRDTLPVTTNDQQLYVETSLESNAIFVQKYLDGWSHKIIPSIGWRAQHAVASPDGVRALFDGSQALNEGSLIELGLRQFFYAPGAEQPWFDLQLLQPYYLSESTALGSSLMPFRTIPINGGLGPSELRMKWTPSTFGNAMKGLSVLLNARYDFELNRADEIVSQISMRPNSNYFYGLNYLEVNGTDQDFALGSAYAGLRASEQWAASVRKSRNFSGDAGFFSTWEVTHYAHDFSVEVGYTRVESTGADGFYFSITPRFVHDTFDRFDYSLRDLR